jgi:hypothetical protein
MMETIGGRPVAYGRLIRRGTLISVTCPHCDEKHWHVVGCSPVQPPQCRFGFKEHYHIMVVGDGATPLR